MSRFQSNCIKNVCFFRTGHPGDAGALERALRLCQSSGANLSIVSVVDNPPEGILGFLASWGTTADAIACESDEADAGERLAKLAREQGVNATSELLRGQRFLEVSRKVLRDKHDLLIKATESTHVVHKVLFGHIDRQLIRKCPCPVWIVKTSNGKTYERILAAVDPAPFHEDPDNSPAREALNTSILQYAQLLAEIEEAELHVVHVWSFDLEMTLRSRAGFDNESVAEVGESLRQKHEVALAELVGPYLRHISRVHLVKGHAGEEIAKLAVSESFDAVVMGTLCRSGLGGLLIGNTAETALDHVNCSIVALKPPGFSSPVQ